MKQLLYLVLVAFLSAPATAQKKQNPVSLYVMPQGSLLAGDHSASGAPLLTAGIQYRNWLFGAGGGVDYYKVRSVPIFAETRYAFGKKPASFFAYAHGGYNIANAKQYQHSAYNIVNSVYNNGWLAEGGVGYNFWNRQKRGLSLGIGYSVKTLQERYTDHNYIDNFLSIPSTHKLTYTFNRIVFTAAIKF